MSNRSVGSRSESRLLSKSHSKDNKEKLEQLKIKFGDSLSRETQEIRELNIIIAEFTNKVKKSKLIIEAINKKLSEYKKHCFPESDKTDKSDVCPFMLEDINILNDKRKALQKEITKLYDIIDVSPYGKHPTVLVGGKSKTQKRRKIGKTRKSRK